MVPLRLAGMLLRDVAADLFRHRGQHLLAMLTLASGLFLAGGGLLLVEGLDRWVQRVEQNSRITLFAGEGQNLEAAEASLRRDPRFSAVRRVSGAEATKRFMETSREAGLLLESLGGESLPESLELQLRPDLLAARKAREAGESLRSLPGVGDVVVDQDRLESMQRTARHLRAALAGLGALLLVAAGFSTGNVIRMSVVSREEEISIMRLVGATERFIRTPLLLEGAMLGLMASAITLAGLFALWYPLSRGWGGLSPLLVQLARLGFFSPRSILLLGLVGASTGALGALWGFHSTQRLQRREKRKEGVGGLPKD